MACDERKSAAKWPWLVFCLGTVAAIVANACGGGSGGGGSGSVSSSAPIVQGYVSELSFNKASAKGTGLLILNARNGFAGPVSISVGPDPNPPSGFQVLPKTASVAVSAVTLTVAGASPQSVDLTFSWTDWPAGKYQGLATVSASTFSVAVPIDIEVTNGAPLPAAVSTWHNDGMRTGANPSEAMLSPATVHPWSFGKLFSHETDGPIEAEPLYMPGVAIPGKGTHNVVYVATLNAFVYAFDADSVIGYDSEPLWRANLGPAAPQGTGGGGDKFEQGIASTPVIDPSTGTIYLVSKNGAGTAAHFELHALDISTGIEKFGGPTNISAQVSGVKGGVGGTIVLQSPEQYQRCGLLLLNGQIYIGIGGLNGDTPPCRGWVLEYNAASLQQTAVFTTEPDTGIGSQTYFAGGGVWMSGAGLSTDGSAVYFATGNGDFDVSTGGHDYGDSVVKLAPSGSTLTVADYFTPYNASTYDDMDLDLGSGGSMLVPVSSAKGPILIQPSKAGVVYVLGRSSMGKFNPGSDNVVQETQLLADAGLARPQAGTSSTTSGGSTSTSGGSTTTSGSSTTSGSTGSTGFSFTSSTGGSTGSVGSAPNAGFWGSAAYCLGNVYFATEHGSLAGYKVDSLGLGQFPFGASAETFEHATPSISYDSTSAVPSSTSIVWAVEDAGSAVLCAYNGGSMEEIYKAGIRDLAGPYIKFGVPMVANGKVYVPTQNGLYVYGLGGFQATSATPKRRH